MIQSLKSIQKDLKLNWDMKFQETSNIPHRSSNDTNMVSFTEENIVIRTHLLMNQWYAFVRIIIFQLELSDFRLTLLL